MRLLLILLAFALALDGGPRSVSRQLAENGDVYLGYAASLLAGDGYTSCPVNGAVMCEHPAETLYAYRAPGFPLFLAGVLAVMGMSNPLTTLPIAQAMLVAVLVALVMGLAGRLAGRRAAIIAGLLLVIHPTLYRMSHYLYSELLFTVLLLALAYLMVFRPTSALVIGLLCGLLLLTRGAFLTTLPFVLFIHRHYGLKRMVLGVVLVMLPWALHNLIVLGAFVPMTTGGGMVLYGAHVLSNGDWHNPMRDTVWEIVGKMNEVEQDKALTQLTIAHLRQQSPLTLISAAINRFRHLVTNGNTFVEIIALSLLLRRLLRRLAG